MWKGCSLPSLEPSSDQDEPDSAFEATQYFFEDITPECTHGEWLFPWRLTVFIFYRTCYWERICFKTYFQRNILIWLLNMFLCLLIFCFTFWKAERVLVCRFTPHMVAIARNSLWIPLTGGRDPHTWTIIWCCYSCVSREVDRKWNSQDLNLHFDMGSCDHMVQLEACCVTILGPFSCFWRMSGNCCPLSIYW